MISARTITDAQLIDLDRFIPMMICRTIISLKKVASTRQLHMSIELPSGLPANLRDIHTHHATGNIQLSVLRR